MTPGNSTLGPPPGIGETARPATLADAGAHQIRLNIRDEVIAAGEGLVYGWQEPQQAAVVQFWMPSANALFRKDVDAALHAIVAEQGGRSAR